MDIIDRKVVLISFSVIILLISSQMTTELKEFKAIIYSSKTIDIYK